MAAAPITERQVRSVQKMLRTAILRNIDKDHAAVDKGTIHDALSLLVELRARLRAEEAQNGLRLTKPEHKALQAFWSRGGILDGYTVLKVLRRSTAGAEQALARMEDRGLIERHVEGDHVSWSLTKDGLRVAESTRRTP